MTRTNIITKHDATINRRVYADKTMSGAVGEYYYTDGNGKKHAIVLSNVGTRVRELNRNLDRVNRTMRRLKTDVLQAREYLKQFETVDDGDDVKQYLIKYYSDAERKFNNAVSMRKTLLNQIKTLSNLDNIILY